MNEKIDSLLSALNGLNCKETVLFISDADTEAIKEYLKVEVIKKDTVVVAAEDTLGDLAFTMSGVTIHIMIHNGQGN